MSLEQVVVYIFFLLPGFLALRVFEWLVASRVRSALEMTSWSLALSIAGAAPLVLIPGTRPYMEHLWQPAELSELALFGVTLQLISSGGLGVVGAVLVNKVFQGRLGRKSFYQRAWDWMWATYGQEDRTVAVQATDGFYLGTLEFADDPSVGQGLLLRYPRIWDDAGGDFFDSGSEYLYVPGERISRVELSSVEEEKRDNG